MKITSNTNAFQLSTSNESNQDIQTLWPYFLMLVVEDRFCLLSLIAPVPLDPQIKAIWYQIGIPGYQIQHLWRRKLCL